LDEQEISFQRQAIQTQGPEKKLIEKKIQQLNDSIKASDLPVQLKNVSKTMDSINSNISQQVKIAASAGTNSDIEKDYGVLWFKENYFLQFEDMRVLLQELDKKNGRVQIQICHTTVKCASENLITTKWIYYDKPLTVSVGDNNYKISLKAIDHAGHNPFKLAAYINVIKLTS